LSEFCGRQGVVAWAFASLMKLLLDENLSRRVVPFVLEAYPGSTQVALIGMEQSNDQAIWDYAKLHGFVIVTRDADYLDLSTLHGQPPKIVWLRAGNQTKAAVIHLLLKSKEAIERALQQEGKACIEIY
jgi:predicted nuclease of predicted toxin-antitoxin system